MNRVEQLEQEVKELTDIIHFLLRQIENIVCYDDDLDFEEADKLLRQQEIYIYDDYFQP